MDFKELLEIISLMKDTDIEEIEFSPERIRVKRFQTGTPLQNNITSSNQLKDNPLPEQKAGANNLYAVNSPFVGTFYRAPSPGAPPFVEVGDLVQKGKTLCIVEAMKLMNEIEAEISGKVVQILKKDGDSVEFGETLFLIEPAETTE
jgi:acetyl-CoA carboxylase biotin carboxyl carrier protein